MDGGEEFDDDFNNGNLDSNAISTPTIESDDELFISEKNIWDYRHTERRCLAVHSKISEYFLEGKYTDVNITCGQDHQHVFECHRLVLAAASEYFNVMFGGKFAESQTRDVTLEDIDSLTFEHILIFIYTGEFPAINDDNVYRLLKASDIFGLSELEKYCVHYLTQKSIPMDDALKIYSFAVVTGKVELIAATSRFILQHLDHFRRESEFLRMSCDDFGTLLTYFEAASASQERRLLDAILEWVCNAKSVREKRRSSFMQLVQKVLFTFVPATYVTEYFDTNLVDVVSDEQSPRAEASAGPSCSSAGSSVEIDKYSLHVYIKTDKLESVQGGVVARYPRHTSVLTLQEKGGEDVQWNPTLKIKPVIEKMRVVELGGRLYSLKLCQEQWTFSSSASIDLSTDLCYLAPPSGLILRRPNFFENNFQFQSTSVCSLGSLRGEIFMCGLHQNVGLQCYNTELNTWDPIVTNNYEPEQIICGGNRLYTINRRSSDSSYFLAMYDSRGDKMELLNSARVSHGTFIESGAYHNGRIYLPVSDRGRVNVSTFRMAIYDPVAGRWDVQNLAIPLVSFSLGRHLVSFNNRLWMFGIDGICIYTLIYDRYLQKWSIPNRWRLCGAIGHHPSSNHLEFMDSISFKSL